MDEEIANRILQLQASLKEIGEIYLLSLQNNEKVISEYKNTIYYHNSTIDRQEILILDMKDKMQYLEEEINRLKTIVHLKDILISEIEKVSKTLKEEKANIYNLYIKIPQVIRKMFAE